jgi:uncharacterized OB-fold protein
VELLPYPTSESLVSVDTYTAPIWEAAGRGELTAAQCGNCKRFRMQPTPFCPNCLSQAIEWPVLSGRGKLYSYTVMKHPRVEGAGYAAAIVELDDAPGIRFVSNVIEADSSDLAIDMPLQAVFQPLSDGYGITLFKPAR